MPRPSWTRTDDEWEEERTRLRAQSSRWMQLGPGEEIDPGPPYRHDGWANGDLLVGYVVLAGNALSLHLVTTPFDGYVTIVEAEYESTDARLEFTRCPAELL